MFFYDGLKSNMTCALKIDTSRRGWYETMSKILGKKQGISYDWDAKEGMLYVSGKIDAQKILKIVKLNKKIVELIYMRTQSQSSVVPSPYHPPSYGGGFYRPPLPPSMSHYSNYLDYNPYHPQLPYY